MRRVINYDVDELRAIAARLPQPQSKGCDFCTVGTLAYRYPRAGYRYRDHRLRRAHQAGHLGGQLAACVDCSELIEAGDWPALARRSFRTAGFDDLVRGGPPGLRVRLLAQLHVAHDCFKRARSGPREVIA